MFRGLAVKLSGTKYKPRCLHAYKQLNTVARKCVEQKHIFASSQQLHTRKCFLIPNKEISQEIGEGIHDLKDTDVKWTAVVTDFCKKWDISYEQFSKMYRMSPLLEYEETLQHLSEIGDILTDYGYGPSARNLLVRNINKFSVTSQESVRAALEEHGRNFLVEWFQSLEVPESEFLNAKLKYPLTAKAYSFTSEKDLLLPFFPWQLLSDHDKFRNKSVAELLADEAGIDKRVCFTLWPTVSVEERYPHPGFWVIIARIARLQVEGLETRDILEHLNMVMTRDKFTMCLEEISKVGVQEFLELNSLLIYSKIMMGQVLGRLFKCSRSEFLRKEMDYFNGKSRVNVATVFFLLADKGFRREEIRKNIFLLGVTEKEIREFF